MMTELPKLWWSDVAGLIVQDPNGNYYRMSYIVSLDDPIAPVPDMARLEFARCDATVTREVPHAHGADHDCVHRAPHVEHRCNCGERWLTGDVA